MNKVIVLAGTQEWLNIELARQYVVPNKTVMIEFTGQVDFSHIPVDIQAIIVAKVNQAKDVTAIAEAFVEAFKFRAFKSRAPNLIIMCRGVKEKDIAKKDWFTVITS